MRVVFEFKNPKAAEDFAAWFSACAEFRFLDQHEGDILGFRLERRDELVFKTEE